MDRVAQVRTTTRQSIDNTFTHCILHADRRLSSTHL